MDEGKPKKKRKRKRSNPTRLGYPPELREQVVREVLYGGLSPTKASRLYGMTVATIKRWTLKAEHELQLEALDHSGNRDFEGAPLVSEEEKERCKNDFWYFLTHHVKTFDELGNIRLFPDWDYLREVGESMRDEHLIIVLKSRQMLVSWVMLGLSLWEVCFHSYVRVLFLSSQLENAKEQKVRFDFMYENVTPGLLPKTQAGEDNKTTRGFVNGSKFMCVAATPRAVRGFSAKRIFLDEMATMQYAELVYRAAKPVVGSGGHLAIVSTPEFEHGKFWELWEEAQEKRNVPSATVHYSARPDRDSKWKDVAAFGLSEREWAREYELTFGDSEGQIYPEFHRDTHVREFEVLPVWRHYRAIDFGCTHPFVCIWAAQDQSGRWWIYDEYYKKSKLLRDHAAEIERMSKAWPKASKTFSDWSRQDRKELDAELLFTCKANKKRVFGIRLVSNALSMWKDGLPGLIVHPRCKKLIEEFPKYQWKEREDGEPNKRFDDALDTLRYIVASVVAQDKFNYAARGPRVVRVGSGELGVENGIWSQGPGFTGRAMAIGGGMRMMSPPFRDFQPDRNMIGVRDYGR